MYNCPAHLRSQYDSLVLIRNLRSAIKNLLTQTEIFLRHTFNSLTQILTISDAEISKLCVRLYNFWGRLLIF